MCQAKDNEQGCVPDKRTYTVEEIAELLGIGRTSAYAQLLGIGRTSAYALVKEGHFKVVRIGNAIRVSKRSFDAWLDEQTF